MGKSQGSAHVFDSAAYYKIVLQGELSSDWAEWLGGMEATVTTSSSGECTTVLRGWLPDQAALVGVLHTIYNLGIPLLSVERLDKGATG